MKSTRYCACCGNKYVYCPSGAKDGSDSWKMAFDSSMCRIVFQTLSDHSSGKVTDAEVMTVLEDNGVTDYSIFKESVQTHINEIVARTKKAARKAAKAAAKTVTAVETVDETVEETTPDVE